MEIIKTEKSYLYFNKSLIQLNYTAKIIKHTYNKPKTFEKLRRIEYSSSNYTVFIPKNRGQVFRKKKSFYFLQRETFSEF